MIERKIITLFGSLRVAIITAMSLFGIFTVCAETPVAGAMWELKMLGVNNADKLAVLRNAPKQRRVSLGVVGQGGVSKEFLKNFQCNDNTITFHNCRSVVKSTHDTGQLNVIMALTSALKIGVDIHIWQPGKSLRKIAEDFREAGKICDVVCFYQSFWGEGAQKITQAIRDSSAALFISPYVESGGRPTSEPPQGSGCKPWEADSIDHLILAVPLAYRDLKHGILTPSERNSTDSEVINFIAPSYYASSSGGTCPAGAVTTACAVFLYGVMPVKPSPDNVVNILRSTSGIDRKLLLAGGMDNATVDILQKQIGALTNPIPGKQRKLDASGVLNLFESYHKAIVFEQ